MKIQEVNAYPLHIPLTEDAPGDNRPKVVIVEVKTADGLTGWGQAFCYWCQGAVVAAIEQGLRQHLIGEDARAIRTILKKLFQVTHIWGRYGITTYAISGVEIALWDLAGKRAGKPLCDLLGGVDNREVHAYASLVRYPEGDERIPAMAKQAKQEGYGMIKLHQHDEGSLQRVREAVGDEMPLTADINCRWRLNEAERMAFALDEYHLTWLEEPIFPPEDFETLAKLQDNTGVPLASGENLCTAFQFKQAIDAGAVTYLQPSVTKVGGIAEWLKVAALTEAASLELAPHSPYFGPGFLATLHLIAVTRQPRWVEKIYYELESPIFTRPLAFKNGTYTLPEGPGLGLEVDPQVLKTYRAKL